jgi:uncharacterized BrkB/YihY/UPF0761 family membrane protein
MKRNVILFALFVFSIGASFTYAVVDCLRGLEAREIPIPLGLWFFIISSVIIICVFGWFYFMFETKRELGRYVRGNSI